MVTSKQVPTVAKKPPAAGMGRKKGTPNKVTGDVKAMVLQALNSVGGAQYLQERAQDPKTQTAFLSLVGKVLPLQVQGAGQNGELLISVIERRIVKAHD